MFQLAQVSLFCFFQDLVESQIRSLPLYPDDPGIVFNEEFLLAAHNSLADYLPEFAHLARCVRVMDVEQVMVDHALDEVEEPPAEEPAVEVLDVEISGDRRGVSLSRFSQTT